MADSPPVRLRRRLWGLYHPEYSKLEKSGGFVGAAETLGHGSVWKAPDGRITVEMTQANGQKVPITFESDDAAFSGMHYNAQTNRDIAAQESWIEKAIRVQAEQDASRRRRWSLVLAQLAGAGTLFFISQPDSHEYLGLAAWSFAA